MLRRSVFLVDINNHPSLVCLNALQLSIPEETRDMLSPWAPASPTG